MPTLDIPSAARMLGVSTDTVRRRIKDGRLEARRERSGRWLVDVDVATADGTAEAAGAAVADRERLVRLQAENEGLRALVTELAGVRDHLARSNADLHEILRSLVGAVPTGPEHWSDRIVSGRTRGTDLAELRDTRAWARPWWRRRPSIDLGAAGAAAPTPPPAEREARRRRSSPRG